MNLQFKKIISVLLILCTIKISSQNFSISGIIKSKNETLPFTSVIVKGTSFGCTSNAQGLYFLMLPKGKYTLVFHFLGYSQLEKDIEVSANTNLNIELIPDQIELTEVIVKAGEDPAVPVIKQAIKKREFYLKQVETYSCQTYIKGLQKITELPKNFNKIIKLFGGKDSDTNELKGILYLSESESNFYFEQPNKVHEEMFSSRVSGDNKAFSFNKLSDLNLNFNKNLIEMYGLIDRPVISPINNNCFFFYKYYLLGSSLSDGKLIHKIKVVPKRNSDACFRGVIYIQDQAWRLTGLDLKLTKEQKLKFVDTVAIKQISASMIGDSIWMPININFSFDFKIFGVKGDGYFNVHLKNYDFKNHSEKKFESNEILKVLEGANKKDSTYWLQSRPIPLTTEELKDYKQKDSIEIVTASPRYKDSVDKLDNKFKFGNLITGYTYRNSKKEVELKFPGLISNGIQYNTVEGVNASYHFTYQKTFENKSKTQVKSSARYGFANKLWGGEIAWQNFREPKKFTGYGVKIKSIVEQYNQADPISPLINSLYTLLSNQNFMKVFKETALELNYTSELFNGVYFGSVVKYAQRDPLVNHSNYLIIDDPTKIFTSNDPRNASTNDSMFTSNRAFTTEFNFAIRFKQKYYTTPHEKIIIGSKYPRLNFMYKRAFPILNSTANYDLLVASLSDEIRLGVLGRFSYRIRGGGFLEFKKLYFMDFKYFLGNQTLINTTDYMNSFRLLPYYTYSADRWFAELHTEHHFRGLIINKIPLIKKLPIQEFIGFHALTSNKLKYYYELNFGCEKIFKVLRIDYILSYQPNIKLRQGFTFGYVLRF